MSKQDWPEIFIHNSAELADGLALVKATRGLSNEALEELIGLTRGHIDKMLGPKREKNIGARTFNYMLEALACRLIIVPDPAREILMRSRWEGRNSKQVRVNASPVSIALVERAKPAIFAELSRKANVARVQKIPPSRRSKIARKAAQARWRKRKE